MLHRAGELQPIRRGLLQQLEDLLGVLLRPLGLVTAQYLVVSLELYVGLEILEQDQKLQQDVPRTGGVGFSRNISTEQRSNLLKFESLS